MPQRHSTFARCLKLLYIIIRPIAVDKEIPDHDNPDGERQGCIFGKKLGSVVREGDLLFSRPDGSPLLPDTVSQAWRRLTVRKGLKGIRLHDARHSHASLMLKQGVHPKIVQERLGHASIQVTLDTYSHVAPGLQEAAAARFDDLVSPKRGEAARAPAIPAVH